MVSSLFPDHASAAFTHFNVWLGLSYSASFAYSSLLCFYVKDVIFLVFSVLTALSHFTLEFKIFRRQKKFVDSVDERDVKSRADFDGLLSVSYKAPEASLVLCDDADEKERL